MRRMRRKTTAVVLAGLGAALWAVGAAAHPHQFVTAQARIEIDANGVLSAVRVAYAMDETESLYIASEFGLDPDGPLTAAQSATVFQAYAEGYAQFDWFAHLSRGAARRALAAPATGSAAMADGVLTVSFELAPEAPLDLTAAPLDLRFYDPSYYALVELGAAPRLSGAGASGCAVSVDRFEPTQEDLRLQAALSLLPPDAAPEDPTIGGRFADRIALGCGAARKEVGFG